MIKGRNIFLSLIFHIVVFVPLSYADHHTPADAGLPESSLNLDFSTRTAVLFDAGIFDPLLELSGRFHGPSYTSPYASLMLGSYARLHENIKIGLFYKLQQGERHDDDWLWSNGEWMWADSFGRFEHLFLFDFSPRFLLPFFPGSNWVFQTKLRYIFNSFNLHHSLYVRPGLTFFVLYLREPIVNISLNYGLYIPLNFSQVFIYEHEPYLNLLFHLSRILKLETSFSFRAVTWTSSQDSIDAGETDYRIQDNAFNIGFGVLFNL